MSLALALSLSAPAAHAATRLWTGDTAAATLDATDGCARTRAWVWAGEDLEGDTGALLYGWVYDTCRGRKLTEFSGETTGVAFVTGRKAATLDADIPVRAVDVRTGAVTRQTSIVHVEWTGGRDAARTDEMKFDWGAWWLGYPGGIGWRAASATADIDGTQLVGAWGYQFSGGAGIVADK